LAEVETDKAVMELVARATGTLLTRDCRRHHRTRGVTRRLDWRTRRSDSRWGRRAGTVARANAKSAPAAMSGVPAPAACDRPADWWPPPGLAAGEAHCRRDGRRSRKPHRHRPPRAGSSSATFETAAAAHGRNPNQPSRRLPSGRRRHHPSVRSSSRRAQDDRKRLVQSIGPSRPTTSPSKPTWSAPGRRARRWWQSDGEGGSLLTRPGDPVRRPLSANIRWVNAWWLDDRIRQWHDIHIGVAVATTRTDHAGHPARRPQVATRHRRGGSRAGGRARREAADPGGVHRLDLLDLEPRHVGIDEFTATSTRRKPPFSLSAGWNRRPWCTTAHWRHATGCG